MPSCFVKRRSITSDEVHIRTVCSKHHCNIDEVTHSTIFLKTPRPSAFSEAVHSMRSSTPNRFSPRLKWRALELLNCYMFAVQASQSHCRLRLIAIVSAHEYALCSFQSQNMPRTCPGFAIVMQCDYHLSADDMQGQCRGPFNEVPVMISQLGCSGMLSPRIGLGLELCGLMASLCIRKKVLDV